MTPDYNFKYSLQDSPIDSNSFSLESNITAEKLKQIEKELQDEAAKKSAAIKVIWVVKFSSFQN